MSVRQWDHPHEDETHNKTNGYFKALITTITITISTVHRIDEV